MEYTALENIYYRNPDLYRIEIENRKNSISSTTFELPIITSHDEIHNLFYVSTNELVSKISTIYEKSIKRRTNSYLNHGMAFEMNYIRKLMIEELQATNEIEGVASTTAEYLSASKSTNKNTRFYFITNKYEKLIAGDADKFEKLEDFRKIYDELMTNEIDEKDFPDGKLFRAREVFVLNGDGNQKPVHTPFKTEEKISHHLMFLLNFINDDSVPLFVRTAVAHYYFEYIHPFYDGNGRTGRYIASRMLFDFDGLLALKLSKVIKDNQSLYLAAFKTTKNGYNKGDVTPFVNFMVDILEKASNEIDDDLLKLGSMLKKLKKYMDYEIETNTNYTNISKQSFFIIAQATIANNTITFRDVASHIGKSYLTVRNHCKVLIDGDLIELSESGRGEYTLTESVYDKIMQIEL